MYNHILVTLDGTTRSETVLTHALEVSRAMGATVTLLRVVDAVNTEWSERGALGRGQSEDAQSPFTGQAYDYLARIAEQAKSTGLKVDVMVKQGHPARQIVAAAKEIDADAIAMATHSRRGLGRIVFGSVAEQVIHDTSLPVLLVRAG